MIKNRLLTTLITLALATNPSTLLATEAKSPNPESSSPQSLLKKKVPYSVVGVFGADTTFGAPDRWVVPIARVIGYKEFGTLDILAQADTLGVSLQADYRTNPSIGVKPHYDYIAHGDYRHFDKTGKRLRPQEVKGNLAAVDLFTTFTYDKLGSKLTLSNGYKWYGSQDQTTIPLPSAHRVHDLTLDASYQNLTTKEVVIKDGVDTAIQLTLQQHGTTETTKRAFAMLGYYNNSPTDYNLKLEARAGVESDSDLQNAWYLGSFISRQAPLPGRGYMQFRNSQFVQAQASLGIPLTGNLRAEPGANIVLFPSKNNITNAVQSDLTHPSLSLTLTGKIAGILPFGVKYGYALPTSSLSASHELFCYIALAWNKLESKQ